MSWRARRPPSAWRDFKFALNQVSRAIEPAIALADVMAQWTDISKALAESPRKRKSQIERYFNTAGQIS